MFPQQTPLVITINSSFKRFTLAPVFKNPKHAARLGIMLRSISNDYCISVNIILRRSFNSIAMSAILAVKSIRTAHM